MALLRQIVLSLLILLIKIGDTVIFLFEKASAFVSLIFARLGRLSKPFRNTPKVKIKRSKTLYKAKKHPNVKKTLLYPATIFGIKTQNALAFLISKIKVMIHVIRLGSITVFTWITQIRFFPAQNKRKSSRKKTRTRAVYKPSFFYKFKFFTLGIVISFLFLFLPLLFLIFASDLPNPSNLSLTYVPKTTKIFDRNGNLLYEIYANQNRTVVKLDEIPPMLKKATIAIEDKDFYNHPGFDLRGIIRALVSNISTDSLQGGSTITQQLIKSAFFSPEPTLKRKIKEVVLAFWAERKYTKDQILSMYFNYVPYGGTAWGIESASEIYFGKNVSDLSLAESAFLAGLPRAPSIYSPFSGEGKLWKKRQKEVLTAMVRDHFITQKQANDAFREELVFQSPNVPIKAPHFVMYVKDLLVQKYGISEVERGGLQIRTSLDLKTQAMVEEKVKENVDANAYLNVQNGAAMVTDPRNGDILAMVGSRDYFDTEHDGNVNVATSLRQPGSTIKLVTYTLALENGFTEATMLDDSPLTIASSDGGPSYTPVNYDGAYHGKQTLRNSFANSFNIPAVRVAQKVGVDNIVDMGKKMGITTWGSPSKYGLSITLGSGEVKMADMATVFGTIANNGQRVTLDPILEVKDASGRALYKKKPQPEQVVNPGVAFIVSDILADNSARQIEFGPNSPLQIPGHRVSVKTGTTDNKRDNWTIGFTPYFVVSTWVGNNDNTPMSQELASGITGAAPMWNSIMTTLLEQQKGQTEFSIPPSVVARNCFGKTAYFVRGTENVPNCRFSPNPTSPTPAFQ